MNLLEKDLSYSERQKAGGSKAEGFLLLRGRFSRSICPKLYGDSYISCELKSQFGDWAGASSSITKFRI
jgi:hypothetical protein